VALLVICLYPFSSSLASVSAEEPASNEAALVKQLQLLNEAPQDQLNEKTDPGFSILRSIYDIDGPDFLTLRKLLGTATVRTRLNPSAKCILAGVISQRWDTFALSGNLWLAGIRSPNLELRNKARRRLISFIQPAHIPELINILPIPGPNIAAYEVLQEVTGKSYGPGVKTWRDWWNKEQHHADIVGHLLQDTSARLTSHGLTPIDQDKFWYLPETIDDAHLPYSQRSPKEQAEISSWNAWAQETVKPYVDEWGIVKPILDRITHQPDPRVNRYLERLMNNPGYGDYAAVVLAWRSNRTSLPAIQAAYRKQPSVDRALARGSLGDRTALGDLLRLIEQHRSEPLSFNIMDDEVRTEAQALHTVAVLPAEEAFELLAHHSFDFSAAATKSQKKKAFQTAEHWLHEHETELSFDRRRGYFTSPTSE
jgi:hypothetical protein